MLEKVEMTVNKFAMRVVGNALGSSISFAIMLAEPNPYAIMVRCLRPMRHKQYDMTWPAATEPCVHRGACGSPFLLLRKLSRFGRNGLDL